MSNDTLNLYFSPLFQSGMWKLTKLPMIASVAMVAGGAVYRVQDGTHTVCTAATANFAGIIMEEIAATDADYATSLKLKTVAVPLSSAAEAEFKVGAGTLTTADVGKIVKFYDYTSLGVDTAGTTGAVHAIITKYLSSTRGRCVFVLDSGAITI